VIDGLPWPAITAASGGWVLFGWLAWRVLSKLTSGDLVTRREVDAKDQEIAALQATSKEQGKQLSLVLGEAMPTVNAVLGALHRAAEERS
jgi:hypothetical protein